jgi:hypothetical protein
MPFYVASLFLCSSVLADMLEVDLKCFHPEPVKYEVAGTHHIFFHFVPFRQHFIITVLVNSGSVRNSLVAFSFLTSIHIFNR